MPDSWFKVALSNFFLAALLGLTLRFAFIQEIPFFKFKNILHAHSHVAMLGWLYLGLFGLIFTHFTTVPLSRERQYGRLFWLTQASVLGMLVSFPCQGYGPISIGFSTLHIFCSYAFAAMLWRDVQNVSTFSTILLRTALGFMVFSTLGIWGMGPMMALNLKHSIVYHLAVQFFLHFQFNGWFVFATLALFFRWIAQQNIIFSGKQATLLYRLLLGSVFFTFALAVAWSKPHPMVFAINSIGVLLQLVALLVFLHGVLPLKQRIKSLLSPINYQLWKLSLLSFTLKVFVQTAVAIPQVAEMAYTIRNYIIGFIHLMMLGILSFFILGLQWEKVWKIDPRSKTGFILLSLGIVLSECLLFGQGTLFWAKKGLMPGYYWILFGVSALMPLGILLLLTTVCKLTFPTKHIRFFNSAPAAQSDPPVQNFSSPRPVPENRPWLLFSQKPPRAAAGFHRRYR